MTDYMDAKGEPTQFPTYLRIIKYFKHKSSAIAQNKHPAPKVTTSYDVF